MYSCIVMCSCASWWKGRLAQRGEPHQHQKQAVRCSSHHQRKPRTAVLAWFVWFFFYAVFFHLSLSQENELSCLVSHGTLTWDQLGKHSNSKWHKLIKSSYGLLWKSNSHPTEQRAHDTALMNPVKSFSRDNETRSWDNEIINLWSHGDKKRMRLRPFWLPCTTKTIMPMSNQ